METLELWNNNGYKIGINNYGEKFFVIASTNNGNSEVITSNVKCKTASAAKRAVTKMMKDYAAVGGKGEFVKVK